MRVVSIMIGRYTVSYDFTDHAAAEQLYNIARAAILNGSCLDIQTPAGRLTAGKGAVLSADIEDPESNLTARQAVAVARKTMDRAIDKAVDESGEAVGIGRD